MIRLYNPTILACTVTPVPIQAPFLLHGSVLVNPLALRLAFGRAVRPCYSQARAAGIPRPGRLVDLLCHMIGISCTNHTCTCTSPNCVPSVRICGILVAPDTRWLYVRPCRTSGRLWWLDPGAWAAGWVVVAVSSCWRSALGCHI